MISSYDEFGEGIIKCLENEDVAERIKAIENLTLEKLGLDFKPMIADICKYIDAKAEPISREFVSMAPYGNYDKLLEDEDGMAQFLRAEATKPENWKLFSVSPAKVKSHNLIGFVFNCTAIDDGDDLSGYVYVSFNGTIKHCFANNDK